MSANIKKSVQSDAPREHVKKRAKPQGNTKMRMGGPGPMGGMRMEKSKDFKKTILLLAQYLKPYYFLIITSVIFSIVSTVFAIRGPKILGNAVNELTNGLMAKISGQGGINFTKISGILLTLLLLYIGSALLSFVQGFMMNKVAVNVSYNLRKELSEKINRLPLSFFDKRTHGEVLSRVTNDVDVINQTLQQSLSQMISAPTALVCTVIMMLTISVPMTLISMVVIPLAGISMSVIIKNSQKFFKKQQEFVGHVNGQVEEVYGAFNIVKAFNAEGKSTSEFDEYNNTLYATAWKSQFLSSMMMPIINFIGSLGYVIVCISGSFFVIGGVINIGDILSFILYNRNFTQPIAQVAQTANILQSTAAAAERVFQFLAEKEETAESESVIDTSELKGSVEFEHVRFGYDPEKVIIHDFSQTVKDGQRIAIVGPTGAGKTTLVKLLMRFYELNSGSIKVDGRDITEYKRGDLRKMIGMVLQDTWLFNGSIMENIRYGRLGATDEEVIHAAKSAYVDHFVRALPHGYDMELNEDATNISQGQKQLLTIARAILADPKILILDEATSSVDTRTEVRIQKAMENLMKGRTSFVIAHRLSTIRDADTILVINDGDIVEQGSHEALLAKNGFYANLYNSQFESGLIEEC